MAAKSIVVLFQIIIQVSIWNISVIQLCNGCALTSVCYRYLLQVKELIKQWTELYDTEEETSQLSSFTEMTFITAS